MSDTEKQASPLSIRVNQAEREQLSRLAGNMGISAYVRGRLFGDGRRAKSVRVPGRESKDIGQVLALLGSSELAAGLRDLAHAAKIGALPVLPETERAINEACAAIDQMRSTLLTALGLRGEAE